MSNNNYQASKVENIGCMVIIGLVVFVAVMPAIIEFIKFLLLVGFFVGIGYVVYKVLNDEIWAERVERWFNLSLSKEDDNTNYISPHEAEVLGLPQAQNDEMLEQLSSMKSKMDSLTLDNKKIKKSQKKKFKKALKEKAQIIARQNKKAILNDLFTDSPTSYAKSDEFERIEFEEIKKKKEQELEIRELKQEMKEQLFVQEKEIIDVKMEAKEDRTHIRMEMKDGFIRVDQMLMQLENKVITLKGYFDEKFSQMEITFFKEITTVKETIMSLRSDVERGFANVKGELSDIKLTFGKEILRIDQAQMRIVNQLGQYENKLRQYSVELIGIKNRAERSEIRGQRLLDQAQVVFQKHQTSMQLMGKNLERGLEQISVHKSEFALKAGQAKLQLDKISQDQYLELKNIGYAEMGVKMLRQDYSQREALGMQKMQNLVAEKRRVEERIQQNLAHGRETAGLRHQSSMLQERVQHANHQNSIMQKEFNVFKQLSRG